MNFEDVMTIAGRLQITIRGYYDESGSTPIELLVFANEVERIEREECAKICEDQTDEYGGQDYYATGCFDCSRSIRSKP